MSGESGPGSFERDKKTKPFHAEAFEDILVELKKLQDSVPPEPFAAIREQVERELGCELRDVYESFDEAPLASASRRTGPLGWWVAAPSPPSMDSATRATSALAMYV